MQAGYKLSDGGRIDVESSKERRRVVIEFTNTTDVSFTLTLSEARAISSALMGAAAEC